MRYYDLLEKYKTTATFTVISALTKIFGNGGSDEIKWGDTFDAQSIMVLLNRELEDAIPLNLEMVIDFCEYAAASLMLPLMRSPSHADENPQFEKDPHWVDMSSKD